MNNDPEWLPYAVMAVLVGVPLLAVWYLVCWLRDPRRLDPDACEECGYDLRETLERCPECGTVNLRAQQREQWRRLREDLPDEPIELRPPGPDERLRVVHSTDNGMLADLLARQLEARGIECRIDEAESTTYAGVVQHHVAHRVTVWSGDAEHAAEVVGRLLSPH